MTEAISVVVEGSRLLALRQPYESAGDGAVQIRYSLGVESRDATLSIIAPTGRVIIDYRVSGGPGEHALLWNRRDWRGMQVARGVYFVQLSSHHSTVNRKFILMHR
jgi:hypothetical protein